MVFDQLNILSSSSMYPQKSGAYLRIINIAKLASQYFEKVSIFSVDESIEYFGDLEGIQLYQYKKYLNTFDKLKYSFNALLSKNFSLYVHPKAIKDPQNTLIQIELPYFYNTLSYKKQFKYILDEHNVCWELYDFPLYSLKYQVYKIFAYERDKKIEINAIKNAEHILVCSDIDKQKIVNEVPEAINKVSVIPNCISFDEYNSYNICNHHEISKTVSYVLFMGLLTYGPNIDAVYSICDIIAPRFENNVKFLIVGANPPNINPPHNVEFLGYVEDIKKYISMSTLCIAPLRYGSGTRFKILEYMAMGKAVISTAKGAEGIEYTDTKNIIIENNIYEYPKRILELLENKKCRNLIGRSAMELICQKYDWKMHQRSLNDIYEIVSKN